VVSQFDLWMALSANVSEAATPWKSNVEGESQCLAAAYAAHPELFPLWCPAAPDMSSGNRDQSTRDRSDGRGLRATTREPAVSFRAGSAILAPERASG
jgi:hypothetical protein